MDKDYSHTVAKQAIPLLVSEINGLKKPEEAVHKFQLMVEAPNIVRLFLGVLGMGLIDDDDDDADLEREIAGPDLRMSVLLRFLVDVVCPPCNFLGLHSDLCVLYPTNSVAQIAAKGATRHLRRHPGQGGRMEEHGT